MSKNIYWVVDYDDPKNPRVLMAEMTETDMLWYRNKYGAIYESKADAEYRLTHPFKGDPWRKAVVA